MKDFCLANLSKWFWDKGFFIWFIGEISKWWGLFEGGIKQRYGSRIYTF
jgi:hypothetical protein